MSRELALIDATSVIDVAIRNIRKEIAQLRKQNSPEAGYRAEMLAVDVNFISDALEMMRDALDLPF